MYAYAGVSCSSKSFLIPFQWVSFNSAILISIFTSQEVHNIHKMFCYIYIDTTALPAAQIWLYSTSSRNQHIIFHVKTGEMAAMFNIMAAILKKIRQIF